MGSPAYRACSSNRQYSQNNFGRQEYRLDASIGYFYVSNREDQTSFILFRNLAREFESSAQFKFCVAVVIKGDRGEPRFEGKISIKKEWILVQNFASITPLRNLDRSGQRTPIT